MNNVQLHDIVKTMLQKGSDANSILSTVNALRPLYEEKKDIAIIPKGTRMKIHGCPFELAQDTKVFATQDEVDNMLKIQQEWDNRPKTGKSGGILSMSAITDDADAPDNSSQARDKRIEEIENAMIYLFRHSEKLGRELKKLLIRLQR